MAMVRIFKTRYFSRWMKKTELTHSALSQAVAEMSKGLIDADLGAGVVKKRIGVAGRGKSSGVRTLVATNKGSRWYFMYGFEKNVMGNIGEKPLGALQDLAQDLLSLTNAELERALLDKIIEEVDHD